MIRNLALWNVIKTLWLFKKKSLLASNQAIQATAEETRGDEEESSAAAPDRQRYRFSLLNLNYHKDCSSMIIQNENIQGCEKLWIPLILNTCYGPLTQERLGKDI
jgi:hypothetical protein